MAAYTSPALRQLISDTLTSISLYSSNAVELLLATSAQESLLGKFRQQVGGPALGIYQMEPSDHDDIWKNYLTYHSDLSKKVLSLSTVHDPSELINNDRYSTAMCRVHYLRSPKPLPSATDLNGLWMMYKVFYNSINGAATQGQFYLNYHRLVTDGIAQ